MKPRVSIILTSYNKPYLINQAIESVISQTFKEWELFIMDDNSCSNTIKIIKKHLNDSRIHYKNSFIEQNERHKTTRYATLINEALPLTRGDYICYLTDDTIYVPHRLAEMVNFLEKKPEVDVVYSSQQVKTVNKNFRLNHEYVRKANTILHSATNIVDHCSVMHTRRILLQVFQKYQSYWDTNPLYWFNADGVFWKRLNDFQPFYPINTVLDITFKTPFSFQNLYKNLPDKDLNGILYCNSQNEIFLIDNYTRRFLSKEMLVFYKYNQYRIVQLPDPFLYKYIEGPPIALSESLPNLRVFQNTKCELFYIENNQKRRFISNLAFRNFKFSMQEIIKVSDSSLDKYTEGPPIYPNLINNSMLPEGKVFSWYAQNFIMTDGMLHPIKKDLVQKLFLEKNCIPISKKELSYFKIGRTISTFA